MLRDLLVMQIPLAEKVLRSIAVYLFLVVALTPSSATTTHSSAA